MAISLPQKVHTPLGVLSYPYLLTPQPGKTKADGTKGVLKYTTSIVFLKGTDLTDMKKALMEAAKEQFGDKAVEMFRTQKLKNPFLKNWEKFGYPEGSETVRVASLSPPGIVSWRKGADGKPMKLDDPAMIYAGRHCRASLGLFYYDTDGNKGISFGLKNIQILRGDEGRWDGRIAAADDFDADDDGTDDAEDASENADLSDLL